MYYKMIQLNNSNTISPFAFDAVSDELEISCVVGLSFIAGLTLFYVRGEQIHPRLITR